MTLGSRQIRTQAHSMLGKRSFKWLKCEFDWNKACLPPMHNSLPALIHKEHCCQYDKKKLKKTTNFVVSNFNIYLLLVLICKLRINLLKFAIVTNSHGSGVCCISMMIKFGTHDQTQS